MDGKKYPIILMTPPAVDVANRPPALAPIVPSATTDPDIPKDKQAALLKLMPIHFDEKKFADAFVAFSPVQAKQKIRGLLILFQENSAYLFCCSFY